MNIEAVQRRDSSRSPETVVAVQATCVPQEGDNGVEIPRYTCPVCRAANYIHTVQPMTRQCPVCGVNLAWDGYETNESYVKLLKRLEEESGCKVTTIVRCTDYGIFYIVAYQEDGLVYKPSCFAKKNMTRYRIGHFSYHQESGALLSMKSAVNEAGLISKSVTKV